MGRWKPNAVMYGFLHMAKSGGTEVNGQLAMHYERICGNKGSSYDFYQANDRHKKLGARNTYYDAQDIISKADVKANISPPHNRGAVTLKILNEIGYEDCDYVALEEHAHTWAELFGSLYRPLELHVPCRDSISLLMSMCNFVGKQFNCEQNFVKEAKQCFIGIFRFNLKQLDHPNINLKCFSSPSKIGNYLDYMGERLQKKVLYAEYSHRDSNRPRNKNEECIWKKESYKKKVENYLTKKSPFRDYFSFCNLCLKSENNLLL